MVVFEGRSFRESRKKYEQVRNNESTKEIVLVRPGIFDFLDTTCSKLEVPTEIMNKSSLGLWTGECSPSGGANIRGRAVALQN